MSCSLIQGAVAIPPTPLADLTELLEASLSSKVGSWRVPLGEFEIQNGVLKASWHSKPTYDASRQFASSIFGPFWRHQGGPNRSKIELRIKKVKMLIFDTPPIKNQCFWVPMAAKMEPKYGSKSICIASENDTWKMMPFREGCRSRGNGQRVILGPGGEGERGRGSIRRRASPKGSADINRPWDYQNRILRKKSSLTVLEKCWFLKISNNVLDSFGFW